MALLRVILDIRRALEQTYGRHQAQIRTISGVYRAEAGTVNAIEQAARRHRRVRRCSGFGGHASWLRRSVKTGHDRGQKVIATAFADLGFDVDVGPLFQTPTEVARQAIEADVHIVGVNSLAAGISPSCRRCVMSWLAKADRTS
ncbi:MAG: hypothetical protein WDN24_18725 [Sphingomonas sp.]